VGFRRLFLIISATMFFVMLVTFNVGANDAATKTVTTSNSELQADHLPDFPDGLIPPGDIPSDRRYYLEIAAESILAMTGPAAMEANAEYYARRTIQHLAKYSEYFGPEAVTDALIKQMGSELLGMLYTKVQETNPTADDKYVFVVEAVQSIERIKYLGQKRAAKGFFDPKAAVAWIKNNIEKFVGGARATAGVTSVTGGVAAGSGSLYVMANEILQNGSDSEAVIAGAIGLAVTAVGTPKVKAIAQDKLGQLMEFLINALPDVTLTSEHYLRIDKTLQHTLWNCSRSFGSAN
jgi:hypothetical protein